MRWMAPELLSGDVESPTVASDIYAMGMVVWQVRFMLLYVMIRA